MENSHQYTAEELQKCPFHNQQHVTANNDSRENPNAGNWGGIDENDEAGTDPNRYEDLGNNDSGETGSEATIN